MRLGDSYRPKQIPSCDSIGFLTSSLQLPRYNFDGEMYVYVVLGIANLTDAAWQAPANSAHRFFKVKVA